MQHLFVIELYDDGIIQRRVRCHEIDGRRMLNHEKQALRRKLYKELENAAKRNPEKQYWIELKTE